MLTPGELKEYRYVQRNFFRWEFLCTYLYGRGEPFRYIQSLFVQKILLVNTHFKPASHLASWIKIDKLANLDWSSDKKICFIVRVDQKHVAVSDLCKTVSLIIEFMTPVRQKQLMKGPIPTTTCSTTIIGFDTRITWSLTTWSLKVTT